MDSTDSTDNTVDPGPDLVPNEGSSDVIADSTDDAAVPTTTEFDLAAQPTTPPIEPVPETGVPGIESADAFCRAWSEFAGSFQALALTSAVGDPADAMRLEVIAASSVTAAVDALEANLPTELEAERVALVSDFAGPFSTRAVSAEAALDAAGIDPSVLRAVWLAAIADAGVDDPSITIETPTGIDGDALEAAISSFSSEQLAIVEDTSLVTDAAIPATTTYLAEVCPDGGILSGNDEVTG